MASVITKQLCLLMVCRPAVTSCIGYTALSDRVPERISMGDLFSRKGQFAVA